MATISRLPAPAERELALKAMEKIAWKALKICNGR